MQNKLFLAFKLGYKLRVDESAEELIQRVIDDNREEEINRKE